MSLRGVIFDFDGVIADTERLHLRAFQSTLGSTTLDLTEAEYYQRYLGYDDLGVFTALSRDHDVTLGPDELARLLSAKASHLEKLRGSEDVLFPDAATCVRTLAGLTTLGIASGALHREIEEILSEGHLTDCFATIVGADDVAHSKPAPDAYQAAVRAIAGTDAPQWASYVAIEDSQWGLASARAAGLRRIGITSSYPAETLTDAEIVVSRLAEIDHRLLETLCRDTLPAVTK